MERLKAAIILLGDIIVLYGALTLTLIIRYGADKFQQPFLDHLKPFSLIFIIWILVFYLSELYNYPKFKDETVLFKTVSTAIAVNFLISIVLFYLLTPLFQLTPKTNLIIFSLLFMILNFGWRLMMVKMFIGGFPRIRLLMLGNSITVNEIASCINSNPQIGYDVALWIKEEIKEKDVDNLKNSIIKNKIDVVILPPYLLKKDPELTKLIYQLLPLEIEAITSIDFFEMIFTKAPLEEVEESWFIEKITTRRHFYDAIKRSADIIFGIILFIILFPVMIITAILIKLASRGAIFYKQSRIGKNDRSFTLYKFRTMRMGHSGPLWTTENDERLTFIGKILRRTHLDEFPQLYNIIKGDISFVGPRPERQELANQYEQLPYYEIRHIIKPGLTGWAQINYRPSASLKEAYEKLKYDIYYIKNRSLFLDSMIILKTIKSLFIKT
ncbi:exopolysaccharide biosynthesis polyprenyl glycosylphosphotransferase [Candidatus Wolfebacteria bacterium]|nr:exopolysaccharide biosynthesis polyprenyl glycosylphosphotransferase [Candidatus Wolfebacteria bacterium]